MSAGNLTAKPALRVDRYAPHWIVMFIIASTCAVWMWAKWQEKSIELSTPLMPRAASSWFFVLQMPQVTPSDTPAIYQAHLENWISTLRTDGFQPMTLSDVLSRLAGGHRLPAQAVVFVFEQAYRQSLETAIPIFFRTQTPATLLTDAEPVREADWGFLSQYRIDQLRKSTLWDVGYYGDDESAAVTLFSSRPQPIYFGKPHSGSIWHEADSSGSLNVGLPKDRLKCLYVNPKWSGKDLVQRMESEIPVESKSYLSKTLINGLPWGIVLPDGVRSAMSFSMNAPQSSRSDSLRWQGTRRLENVKVALQVQHVNGEFWTILRSDPDHNHSIAVGFLHDHVVIDQVVGGRRTRLESQPWDGFVNGDNLQVSIMLDDHYISVKDAQGKQIVFTAQLKPVTSDNHYVELMVYDNFYGTAIAEGITLFVTPLNEEPS